MHAFDDATQQLADAILAYVTERMQLDPVPLDGGRDPAVLAEQTGVTITPDGIGGQRALHLFDEVLSTACLSVDHPRYLSFIPAAPTEASMLFDLVVGASSIYGGSWLEGSGAVHVENETLRWLADLAGFPVAAGGTFVQGGTLGNLSALVAAREDARRRPGIDPRQRWTLVCGEEAHSSVVQAARVLDADVRTVPVDAEGRMTGAALAEVFDAHGVDDVCAVVATGGTTQFGTIDDLAGIGAVCRQRDVWMHVDGAYGLAGLVAPSVRDRFAGIELADSFIVDPHKWLFAPFDACALVYRDPRKARAAHEQRAGYLEVLELDDVAEGSFNPSDVAIHLSRRARGLPLWFSLATHGTDAYAEAVEYGIALAATIAAEIAADARFELLRAPELSIVVFRRLGWSAADHHAWSARLLAEGHAFVMPTVHRGETVARLAIVNPKTSLDDLRSVLATM